MANRQRHAKKIDTVHWTYGSFDAAGVAASATVGVNVLSAQHLPETLLRIRGEWACAIDGALATPAGQALAVGLILVPEGTATTVLWSPITDGDAPWIWWDSAMLLYEEAVVDVMQSTVMTSSMRRVIDSKAMRKVRNTELQFVVEVGAGVSGYTSNSINCSGQVRVLSGS